jgi:hypothetical protein
VLRLDLQTLPPGQAHGQARPQVPPAWRCRHKRGVRLFFFLFTFLLGPPGNPGPPHLLTAAFFCVFFFSEDSNLLKRQSGSRRRRHGQHPAGWGAGSAQLNPRRPRGGHELPPPRSQTNPGGHEHQHLPTSRHGKRRRTRSQRTEWRSQSTVT